MASRHRRLDRGPARAAAGGRREAAPEHVPALRLALPRRRARREPARLPAVRPPLPRPRARPDRAARRRRHVRRVGRRAPLGRSARVLRPDAPTPSGWRRPRWRPASATRSSPARPRSSGAPCELAVMDFAFMGGSMGSVVGEKFARACRARRRAARRRSCAVTASGGARMQEGILSLMQMPKTVARGRRRCARPRCAVRRRHDPPDDGRRARELRAASAT